VSRVTIIQARRPPIVAKRFSIVAGNLVKEAVANISEGLTWSKPADTAEELAGILSICVDRDDCALILDTFIGDGGGPVWLVPEQELARIAGWRAGSPHLAGIKIGGGGKPYAARLKRSLRPSGWILIDADNPPGMPEALQRLSLAERLEKLEEIVPGIASSERVVARSSSARVRREGVEPGGSTHAFIRVNDPAKIETLRLHLMTATVCTGLSFPSPRRSRKDGRVIGSLHRTLIDLAVLLPGRIVFTARPTLDDAMPVGWQVHDAGIAIENAGGGVLDLSSIQLPNAKTLREVHRRSGSALTIRRKADGVSLVVHETGSLTLATEIEVKGEIKAFGEWLARLAPEHSLRCETPFRESSSEAAFIKRTSHPRYGEGGWLHAIDSGTP
jgi:hypothetical protein